MGEDRRSRNMRNPGRGVTAPLKMLGAEGCSGGRVWVREVCFRKSRVLGTNRGQSTGGKTCLPSCEHVTPGIHTPHTTCTQKAKRGGNKGKLQPARFTLKLEMKETPSAMGG